MGSQKLTPTPLTDRQLAMLDVAQKAGFNRNITKLCKEAGVSRIVFYEWMDAENEPQFQPFRDAWKELPRRMLAKHLPGIILAQIQAALEGSSAAAKLILDFLGELGPEAARGARDWSKLSLAEKKTMKRLLEKATIDENLRLTG